MNRIVSITTEKRNKIVLIQRSDGVTRIYKPSRLWWKKLTDIMKSLPAGYAVVPLYPIYGGNYSTWIKP